MSFKTNAVDSFSVNKIGHGNGECKIYLRGGRDQYYRDYFKIDSTKYGYDSYTVNGQTEYREKGNEICYIDKIKTSFYLEKLLYDNKIDIASYNNGISILCNITDDLFHTNYLYDSQSRCYIRARHNNYFQLRNLCISKGSIICFEEKNGKIAIHLEVGQL